MKKISVIFLFMLSLTIWAQDYIEVVNIENPVVQAYLADSTYYFDTNYKNSISSKYGSRTLDYDTDWPQGKVVKWSSSTPAELISEVRISVSENANYKDCATHNPSKLTASSFTIRNTIPGCMYYYKVEEILNDGDINLLTEGAFRTTGQLRMIQVRGSHNVRDLGGWPTQYGVPIKYGRLYRSGNLDKMNSFGYHDFVENLNVGAELDLRSESKLVHSRLGEDKDLLISGNSSYMVGLTKSTSSFAKDLQWIVARLREGKNVDWHCAIGCDRCGTLSFLIEGLLGVGEIDLCRDYELSTFSKHERTRDHLNSMIKHIQTFGPADDLALCFYNYWLNIGLTQEDLNFFLHEMLGIDPSKIRR